MRKKGTTFTFKGIQYKRVYTRPATATKVLAYWQAKGWIVAYVSPAWDYAELERKVD